MFYPRRYFPSPGPHGHSQRLRQRCASRIISQSVRPNLVPCFNLVLSALWLPAHASRALESCRHAGEGFPCCSVTSSGTSGAANNEQYQVKARYQLRANALLDSDSILLSLVATRLSGNSQQQHQRWATYALNRYSRIPVAQPQQILALTLLHIHTLPSGSLQLLRSLSGREVSLPPPLCSLWHVFCREIP